MEPDGIAGSDARRDRRERDKAVGRGRHRETDGNGAGRPGRFLVGDKGEIAGRMRDHTAAKDRALRNPGGVELPGHVPVEQRVRLKRKRVGTDKDTRCAERTDREGDRWRSSFDAGEQVRSRRWTRNPGRLGGMMFRCDSQPRSPRAPWWRSSACRADSRSRKCHTTCTGNTSSSIRSPAHPGTSRTSVGERVIMRRPGLEPGWPCGQGILSPNKRSRHAARSLPMLPQTRELGRGAQVGGTVVFTNVSRLYGDNWGTVGIHAPRSA
jgi:hypothetical protein